jgi:hypothetical protein
MGPEKSRVRRQTGSPNSGLQSGRARIGLYDALTTTTRIAREKRRRDEIAAPGTVANNAMNFSVAVSRAGFISHKPARVSG